MTSHIPLWSPNCCDFVVVFSLIAINRCCCLPLAYCAAHQRHCLQDARTFPFLYVQQTYKYFRMVFLNQSSFQMGDTLKKCFQKHSCSIAVDLFGSCAMFGDWIMGNVLDYPNGLGRHISVY